MLDLSAGALVARADSLNPISRRVVALSLEPSLVHADTPLTDDGFRDLIRRHVEAGRGGQVLHEIAMAQLAHELHHGLADERESSKGSRPPWSGHERGERDSENPGPEDAPESMGVAHENP